MLYYITILIIFLVLGYAGIVLFKRFRHFQKRKEKLKMKETKFIDKLVTEENKQPDKSFQMGELIEDPVRLKKTENLLAQLYEIINNMPEEEMRQVLKDLEERQKIERRKFDRKDFLRIVDYSVGGQYYRDFIQDLSSSGVFIKTSRTFSEGQTILMTFMSPDNQSPFKIIGEIIRIHTNGIGVKFKIESQVQELVLKSFVDMIQI